MPPSARNIVTASASYPREPKTRPPPLPSGQNPGSEPRQVLQPNQHRDAPSVVSPFDGRVASQDGLNVAVITSPNQDWVPAHPVERRVVRTFSDGLWGEHEYSRWPQPMIRNMWHLGCIPSLRHPQADIPPAVWTLLSSSRDWAEDVNIGVPGLGFLLPDIRSHLCHAAERATSKFMSIAGVPPHRMSYGEQLCLVLRQCLERMMRLPSDAVVSIAVGAHIQRVTLELLGLHTYLTVVLPRMDSTTDFSLDVLPVLGLFASDAATVQLATRVGLPIWFIQPLTRYIKIWKVVTSTAPYHLSQKESSPPMRHHPDELGAIANLTSSWVSNMVFAITGQLCSGTLAGLDQGQSCGEDGPMKTRRVELMPVEVQKSKTGTGQGKTKKTRRSGRRHKSGNTDTVPSKSPSHTPGPSNAPAPSDVGHPSRQFNKPLFLDVPHVWAVPQRDLKCLPQPRTSVHYFYPPPFLLDTISSATPVPDDVQLRGQIRRDEKVHRYLHNAIRIRAFCRLRLLDITVSGDPLTISEWRAALWGDYQIQDAPDSTAHDNRLKRKIEGQNDVARLFGSRAALPSYSEAQTPDFDGMEVSQEMAATDLRVRQMLLWECHEINFRCEVMALDAAVVPRSGWNVMQRWGRETFVAGIWSEGGSIASIIPLKVDEDFHWRSPPDERWQECTRPLRRFLAVMATWPGCPDDIKTGHKGRDWTSDEYEVLQLTGTRFYTAQFTTRFGRLPIPPVALPSM